jgi:hypothetical protein
MSTAPATTVKTLIWAIRNDDLDVVKFIVEKNKTITDGTKLDLTQAINEYPLYRGNAFDEAIAMNRVEIAKYLYEEGFGTPEMRHMKMLLNWQVNSAHTMLKFLFANGVNVEDALEVAKKDWTVMSSSCNPDCFLDVVFIAREAGLDPETVLPHAKRARLEPQAEPQAEPSV